MDVKKDPKQREIIDVNQTMNNLLTKVAEAITAPEEETTKNLQNIRDLLLEAALIDKTTSYILTEDTISKVNKALETVVLPTDKSLKAIGIETPTPDKTFKLDDSEIPQTEEEARTKFNQIVNANLEKTVKAIEDIIVISEAEQKGDLEVPVAGESAGKILSDVLLTLLAKSLKQVSNIEFPERSEKESEEISLNVSKRFKNEEFLEGATEGAIKTSEDNLLDGATEGEVKQTTLTGQSNVKDTKEAFGIGQFPSFGAKTENEFFTAVSDGKPAINTVESPEIDAASAGLEKIEDIITPAEEAEEKILQSIEAADEADEKALNASPEAIAPVPLSGISDLANAPRSKDQIGTQTGVTVPGPVARKPGEPNSWYGNWGFLWGAGNNPQNNIASGNVSAGGVSTGDVNSAFGRNVIGAGLQRAIGGTLTFFGLSNGDIGRFVNAQRRQLNTIANAFELTTQIQGIEMERPYEQGNDARRRLEGFVEYYDLEAYRYETPDGDIYENKRTGKTGLTQEDLPANQQEWITQPIKDRGKIATSDSGEKEREGDFAVDDTTFEAPLIMKPTNSGSTNQPVSADGTITFEQAYRERTFDIVNQGDGGGISKAPGFLKIYTRRGPRFSYSQEEIKIIPFQFDPMVSGDTKAADYATIATLGRSQSAQVYRRSSERTISLELNYIVVNSPKAPNDFTNNAVNDSGESSSMTTSDMQNWTEDYIYTYVVRNLRNLTLPNIIGPRFKLAPPIIQVWYGGISSNLASSTGEGIDDPDNNLLRDVYPVFRTNWYSSQNARQQSYRSLWVCKSVSFDYKGGVVNSSSRNNNWVTATLSLTEIAPSVTDNEVLLWAKIS